MKADEGGRMNVKGDPVGAWTEKRRRILERLTYSCIDKNTQKWYESRKPLNNPRVCFGILNFGTHPAISDHATG